MGKIDDNLGKVLIEKYRQGIKVKILSSEYGISQSTLNNYFNANNVERFKYESPRKFPKEKEDFIIKLYKEGKTTKEIGLVFNTYNTSIRRVLIRRGIRLRDNSRVNRLCKHNPFKKNDEYSDYFLGLLLTDGSITKDKNNSRNYGINLSLSEVDSYMVEIFRDWASPKQKITKTYQRINGSYMHAVTITNSDAEEWLRRRGNFYSKSLNCKIYIPLNWNILRGIFDGDGEFFPINRTGIGFMICSASRVFIDQIKMFLNKNGIEVYIDIKPSKHPLYYIKVYKQQDIIKIGKMMYNNAHIFLKRKYDKWLAFYESRRANGVNSGNEKAI